jgi:glucokinase
LGVAEMSEALMTKSVLLVDVEEDRAAFAMVAAGDRPGSVDWTPCTDEFDLLASLQRALAGFEGQLCGAAFAAPGPVVAGAIQLTHVSLRLEQSWLEQELAVPVVRLVNDFSARAMAMPLLDDEGLEQMGGRRLPGQAPAAALGPSGGLGVAILNPDGFVGWGRLGR